MAVGRPEHLNREAAKWLRTVSKERQDSLSALKSSPPTEDPAEVDDSPSLQYSLEMENLRREARDTIAMAIASQAKHFNKHRRLEVFEPDDEVLVNPHSLQWIELEGPGRKLVQRWIGPFRVQERISDSVYDLAMPDSYSASTIFNIDHLKRYHRSPEALGDRATLTDLRVDIIPSEEYEVERILVHGWVAKENRMKYFVRWKGYGSEHDSWVSIPDLKNARELLYEYQETQEKGPRLRQQDAQRTYDENEWLMRPSD